MVTGNDKATTIVFSEEKSGRFKVGYIALNNPRALNALDLGMLQQMEGKLLEWRQDEDLACVVVYAESEKAFCAGGDVKSLVLALQRDRTIATARDYFTTEYFVDYLIHVYPKPILCWADGITMGGGIGIMNGASSRVVTERTVMAMPEIGIGLFPDVGATYFLNRLPAGLGLFLGLTGARFGGYDAAALGMADGIMRSEKKGEIFAGLSRLSWSPGPRKNKQTLRDYVASAAEPTPSDGSDLLKRLDIIKELTIKATVEEVDNAFRGWIGNDEWIRSGIDGYLSGSPTFREGDLSTTDEREGVAFETDFPSRVGHGAQFLRALRLLRGRKIPLDRQRPEASVGPVYVSGRQKRGGRALVLQTAWPGRSS